MRKIVLLLFVLIGAYYAFDQADPILERAATGGISDVQPETNTGQWRSGEQVQGQGTVTRILSDDNDGSRHQRMILRLASGRTLLIAHNIDLAPRVPSLKTGDTLLFYGEYEQNEQGGVIHWTHNDPQGRHVAGWLEHNGRRYQ